VVEAVVVIEASRHLTASMVVLDPDTYKVLLVHHLRMDRWVFPGGHIEQDQAPAEAAIREVHEETGVWPELFHQFKPLTLPGMVQQPMPFLIAEIPAPANPASPGYPAEPAHSHIDLLFIGTADSSVPTKAQLDEVAAVRWVPVDGLAGLDVRAEVPQVARAAWIQLMRGDH
jgi:8-oxo-dGTP diphosphatase